MSVSEIELIQNLTRDIVFKKGPLKIGVGDDCSVIRTKDKDILVSCDSLIENVHFKKEWASWEVWGKKAAGAALSDIAAMGGKPVYAWCHLGFPPSFSASSTLSFYKGLKKIFKNFDVVLAGGNICHASSFTSNLTVWGEAPHNQFLTRSGAKAGDKVYIFGNIGYASLGLQILKKKWKHRSVKKFTRAFFYPKPHIDFGRYLAKNKKASSCIDVSDGLWQDLNHIAHASKVRIILEGHKIPLAKDFQKWGQRLKVDPLKLVLTGGEDYALAYTSSASTFGPWTKNITEIGSVEKGAPGVQVIDPQGKALKLSTHGFQYKIKK